MDDALSQFRDAIRATDLEPPDVLVQLLEVEITSRMDMGI